MRVAEHEARFSALVMAVVEELAAPAELAEFQALLRVYPEFKLQYLEQIRIHGLMRYRCQMAAAGFEPVAREDARPQTLQSASLHAAAPRRWFPINFRKLAVAVAASFLAVCTLWFAQKQSEAAHAARQPPLPARHVQVIHQRDADGLVVPEHLPGNLRLRSGQVTVHLSSGVHMIVLGPAEMRLKNHMEVRLYAGRIMAEVSAEARGFMVQTPELEMWDMGTIFGVSVAEGASDVFVFKGSVQVNEASGEAVDLCREGEGVRALAGERPVKIAADWDGALKILATVQGKPLTREPAKALDAAETITDQWAERYMPRLAKDGWLTWATRINRKGQRQYPDWMAGRGEIAFAKKRKAGLNHTDKSTASIVASPTPAFKKSAAAGSVPDFRNAVRREASLIHHYTFEGPQADAADMRLLDRAGAADLVERVRNTSMPQLAYDTGHDALSYAGVAVYSTNSLSTGRAWTTAGAIALPRAMTIECVVSPYAIPPLYGAGVVTSRAADNQRGYYVWLTTGGAFETRVGGGDARTILSNVSTGHWYYIVNTYDFDGAQTTVNSYCADLTAGTPLQHVIMDAVDTGGYGESAVLGIGVLLNLNDELQYFAPCAIDEVALYAAAHDFDKINSRFEALRRPLPTVAYREIFPNDNHLERSFPCEGWQSHYGLSATHTDAIKIPAFDTAFNEDILAVASFPSDTGAIYGYLNNHGGPTDINYLYWTGELAGHVDAGDLKLVTFDARFSSDSTVRVALRVDVGETPEDTGDDMWFVSADFMQAAGTGALAIPSSIGNWHWHWLDVRGTEWARLDFVPGTVLALGNQPVALPASGRVTACGLFQDTHTFKSNARYDNFTLYASRAYMARRGGTVIRVQ